MSEGLERRLKLAALGLSGIILLQLVWGSGRLIFMGPPEPVLPTESSLRVAPVAIPAASVPDGMAIIGRPVFWQGREAYIPPEEGAASAAALEEGQGASGAIDKVKLLGVYGGEKPGAIILYQGERRRVQLEESVEDWTMTMTSPVGVVFESSGEMRTLQLQHTIPEVEKAVKQPRQKK